MKLLHRILRERNPNGAANSLPMKLLVQQYLDPKNMLIRSVNDAELIASQEQLLERILTRMIARIVAIL